jgi:hypothetical protein
MTLRISEALASYLTSSSWYNDGSLGGTLNTQLLLPAAANCQKRQHKQTTACRLVQCIKYCCRQKNSLYLALRHRLAQTKKSQVVSHLARISLTLNLGHGALRTFTMYSNVHWHHLYNACCADAAAKHQNASLACQIAATQLQDPAQSRSCFTKCRQMFLQHTPSNIRHRWSARS